MITTDAYDTDILDMARKHYGYGRWNAPYWFIGPAPGQPGSDDLQERCKAWVDLGRRELIDCKEHHFAFGWKDWHRDEPPPRLQQTWRPLILLLLASLGTPADNEDIREYQRTRWGNEEGETCVIELSSIAAPKLAAPGAHNLFLKERINVIRKRMRRYKPAFVVLYGVGQKPQWEAIAGGDFPPDNVLRVGHTLLVHTKHPVSFGLPRSYWSHLAERVRQCAQQ